MNDSKTITNEMLYELIKEFKRDVYKRFDQQDARFEQIEKNLTEFKSETKQNFIEAKDDRREMKSNLHSDKAKLEKIYESRDRVSVNFTRSWMFASFFLALLSSTIVLAVEKAF